MKMVDFPWRRCLDGYRLDDERNRLSSASDRFEQYRPLEIPGLFAIFAEDTPASAKGMLGFCDGFGLPGGGRPDMATTATPTQQRVDDLLGDQREMRRALSLLQRGNASELSRGWNSSPARPPTLVRIELGATSDGRMEMAFLPPDLIQAMWLQFAQFACSGAQLLRCERCNTPFVVGSGTGRRSTSKWCSNACKVAAFQQRQAQAREGTK
jgi:hypothetical protein